MSQAVASTPALSWQELAQQSIVLGISLLISLGLHLGVFAPYLLSGWLWEEPVELNGPEDGGDGPLGDARKAGEEATAGAAALRVPIAPVRIALYVPPAPTPDPATTDPATTDPAPDAAAATPSAVASTDKESAPATGTTGGSGSGSSGTGQGGENAEGKEEVTHIGGVVGKPPRGNKKPCEPIEEVTAVSDTEWRVERALIDYYATHLNQLGKQAGTSTHTNEAGEKDGVQIYLPRCSVLRQGGLKNGDVIHSINGHGVATLAQAVSTWMRVRNDRNITVKLTRKNGEALTYKYRITR